MTKEIINKQILITTFLLFGVILLFQFTNLDIDVQNEFFDFKTVHWLLNRDEPVLRLILYDGLKKVLIGFAVGILFLLLFFRKNEWVQKYKKGLQVVLLASIIVPLTIGGLKAVSNTPCPKNIEHFGGRYPDVKVFDSYPNDFIQEKVIKCWPAGHASGGFALLSLFFLFKKRRNRMVALSSNFILAWSMGTYKMLIGDHFLSHTIITMLIAWIEILVIVKFIHAGSLTESFDELII